MRQESERIRLSATDLANHLGCGHLTNLNVRAAVGELEAPHYHDPALELLQLRGLEHEKSYVTSLLDKGMKVVRLDGSGGPRETLWAMKSGPEAIVQASLAKGRWFGRADILRRVETPSKLGSWSYEVIDTKLARETRAGTILQLSLYSDLLARIQGQPPEYMYVVPPRRRVQ